MRSLLSNRLKFRPIVTILALSLAGCGAGKGRLLEESFEQLYTVEPNVNITVQNGDGAVLVYGSNVNEMRVQAVKRAYQRARLKQIAIDVSNEARLRFNHHEISSKIQMGSVRSLGHGRLHRHCSGNR